MDPEATEADEPKELQRHHSCDGCSKVFGSQLLLKQHILKVHAKPKRFSCPQCSMGFDFNSSLNLHISNVHGDDLDKEYQCGECLIVFLVKDHLKNHLRTQHLKPSSGGPARPTLEQSPRAGKTEPRLQVRLELVEDQPEQILPDEAEPLYDDDMQEFDDSMPGDVKPAFLMPEVDLREEVMQDGVSLDDSLPQQQQHQQKQQKHLCTECGREFKQKYHLKRHVDNVHLKKKRFLMPQVNLREEGMEDGVPLDKSLSHQQEQQQQQKQQQQFHCTECDKEFKQKHHLKRHVDNVHLKIRRFFCPHPHCRAAFYFKAKQEKHVSRCSKKVQDSDDDDDDEGDDECEASDEVVVLGPEEIKREQSAPDETLPSSQTPPGQFCCDQCGKSFGQMTTLRRHIDNVHFQIKNFLCSQCDAGFFSKIALVRHTRSAHTKDFRCLVCKIAFQEKAHLVNHQRLNHPDAVADADADGGGGEEAGKDPAAKEPEELALRFLCDECGKDFSSKASLKAHNRYVHLKSRAVKCPLCPKTFTMKFYLRKHLATVDHEKETDAANLCQHCGQVFATQDELRSHVKEYHTRDDRFFCKFCVAGFTMKRHLKAHVEADHSKEKRIRFLCKVCNAGFPMKRLLRAHIETEHSEGSEKFFCRYCAKGFVRKHHRLVHVLTEHKDQVEERRRKNSKQLEPEVLLDSELDVDREVELDSEMQNLEPEVLLDTRPVCDVSEDSLGSSSMASTSVTLQTFKAGDRTDGARTKTRKTSPGGSQNRPKRSVSNQPCEYCGKVFARSDHLKVHVRDVHLKIQKFSCSLCNKSFSRKSSRDVHIALQHNQFIDQPSNVVDTYMKYAKC